MTVRKKIDKSISRETMDVDSVISRGANVKEDSIAELREWSFVNLRIPSSLLFQVDQIIDKKVGISRTGWILQTIQKAVEEDGMIV